MDTMTDRLERLAELQKKSLEPIQTLGGNAFALFERVARKNYELMGDMVEYAVVQSRGSLEQSSPQALYEHQMAEARAFAERMSGRAAEYMALLEEMRGELAEDGENFREDLADRASTVAEEGMREMSDLSATSAGVAASATPGAGTSAKKRATKKGASAGGDSKGSAASGKKRASKKASGKKASGKKASGKKASGKKASGKKASGKKRASS